MKEPRRKLSTKLPFLTKNKSVDQRIENVRSFDSFNDFGSFVDVTTKKATLNDPSDQQLGVGPSNYVLTEPSGVQNPKLIGKQIRETPYTPLANRYTLKQILGTMVGAPNISSTTAIKNNEDQRPSSIQPSVIITKPDGVKPFLPFTPSKTPDPNINISSSGKSRPFMLLKPTSPPHSGILKPYQNHEDRKLSREHKISIVEKLIQLEKLGLPEDQIPTKPMVTLVDEIVDLLGKEDSTYTQKLQHFLEVLKLAMYCHNENIYYFLRSCKNSPKRHARLSYSETTNMLIKEVEHLRHKEKETASRHQEQILGLERALAHQKEELEKFEQGQEAVRKTIKDDCEKQLAKLQAEISNLRTKSDNSIMDLKKKNSYLQEQLDFLKADDSRERKLKDKINQLEDEVRFYRQKIDALDADKTRLSNVIEEKENDKAGLRFQLAIADQSLKEADERFSQYKDHVEQIFSCPPELRESTRKVIDDVIKKAELIGIVGGQRKRLPKTGGKSPLGSPNMAPETRNLKKMTELMAAILPKHLTQQKQATNLSLISLDSSKM